MVDDHAIEEESYHDEIGLRGVDFNFLMKTRMVLIYMDLLSIIIY